MCAVVRSTPDFVQPDLQILLMKSIIGLPYLVAVSVSLLGNRPSCNCVSLDGTIRIAAIKKGENEEKVKAV